MIEFDYIKFKDINERPIELRAKQFGELLSKDNFFLFYPKVSIEESPCLDVLSVHVTKDVYIKNQSVNEYLSLLAKVPFHAYYTEHYTTHARSHEGKRTGIVIRSKFRKSGGSSVRLSLYDKYEESKEERYKGVLRLELKLTKLKLIRQRLGITHNTLYEVLHSEADPIENLLQTIYEQIDQNKIIPMTNELRLKQLHAWFLTFNYDWTAIRNDLLCSNQTPSQIKTVRKQFQEVSRLKNNLNYTELFNQLSKVKHRPKAPEPNQSNPNQLKLIA